MVTQTQAHLYDAIEADLIGGEGFLLCSLDIDSVESRFRMNRRVGFDDPEVDRLDKLSPVLVRIDSNDPVG